MERVWPPVPCTVIGSPRSAWLMKVGMARPSSGRIRGPYVLKIRTMAVSSPWKRWYAIVAASEKRLASS
jgi:hypothetical protein